MVKIAFFDIDGTLVSFKTHVISETSLRCLDTLKSRGVKVFIASGRHKQFMNNLQDYPFDGYMCMNGGLVIAEGSTVYGHPMDMDESRTIARILHENSVPCIVYQEERVIMTELDDIALRILKSLAIEPLAPTSLLEAAQKPVYQYTPVISDAEFKRLLAPYMHKSVYTRWHPDFVDIVPLGVSKAVGIEKTLGHYGLKREEVIAFGDGDNDIEMIKYAGIGVAMGNAAPEVKAHADYVTTSVDEEGVAAALEHFGLL